MLDVRDFKAQDLRALSPAALAGMAEQMLQQIGEQARQIATQAQAIQFRDVKIERITHRAGAAEGVEVRSEGPCA